jgi:carboxyl-terminal processing protease
MGGSGRAARAGGLAALLLCALLGGGFSLDGPHQVDYSDLSWSAAFAKLCSRLAREYPFTEWKSLDWAAMESSLAPRVARAEAAGDRRAFYLALRELVWQMRDGHARLAGDDGGLRQAAIGGSYGLQVVEIDDHRILAGRIAAGGPTDRAGVRFGAEIAAWNGVAIGAALAAVPVLWTDRPPATREGRRLAQEEFLARAPVGAHASVTFRNPGEPGAETRELVATAAPAEPSPCLSAAALLCERTVEARPMHAAGSIAGGAGYVRIRFELPTLRQPRPERALRRALAGFAATGLPGVIIDVRGNCGGADAMVPPLVAPLLTDSLFYEQPGIFRSSTGRFAADPRQAVTIVPRPPLYRGRIAVLVDVSTVSAGEAIPYLLKGRPGTAVIGWHATQGSFGIGEKSIVLPAGLRVLFPHAQSLDAAGAIEVDADAAGRGGVEPDRRLPLTEDSFQRWLGMGEDLPLAEAIRFVRGED